MVLINQIVSFFAHNTHPYVALQYYTRILTHAIPPTPPTINLSSYPLGMFSLKNNDSPRTDMLYNYYYNPADPSASTKTFWTSVPCAVRNSQYKLLHTYEASGMLCWK